IITAHCGVSRLMGLHYRAVRSPSPKGLDETPQSVARGGSLAARGKRVYSSCGSRREYFDATSFPNTQLLLGIWKEFLKRSTSTSLKRKTIFSACDVSQGSFPCPIRRSWTWLMALPDIELT